jgi:alkylhydroperoxidase/carboxymuconolactone decarboxylase family protein YurZ
MVENSNDSPDDLNQKYTEIYAEIREIIDGTRSIGEIKGTGALSLKLRELIALGSAIATQRGRATVVSCVHDCLKAGVSREHIFEVLRLAILMVEVPAESCDKIVREALEGFDSQD